MDFAYPEKPVCKFDDLTPEQKDFILVIVRACIEKLQELGFLSAKTVGSIEQQEAAVVELIDKGFIKPEVAKCESGDYLEVRLTVWNGSKYIPLGKFSDESK